MVKAVLIVFFGIVSFVQSSLLRAGETIMVFAAASLTGALSEISEHYKTQNNVRVSTVFASSSSLAKQIINGAPADIFISANQDWMNRVEKSGRIERDSRFPLLANRLSLIAPSTKPESLKLTNIDSILTALEGGRLAMGDPDHVPAGMYAKSALESLGLWQALKGRIAAASDVRAALVFVERGEAALGIVYSSDTVGRPDVIEVGKFPRAAHSPISYPAALIRNRISPSVRQFFRFLQSDDARVIFLRHGFSVP